MSDRIAITGFGVKAAGGENNMHLLDTLLTGKTAFELYSGYAPRGKNVALGLVKGSLGEWDEREYAFLPRFVKLALASTQEALALSGRIVDPRRCGLFFGTSLGGTHDLEATALLTRDSRFRDIPTHVCGLVNYHSASSAVSHYFDLPGITKTVVTGCTSGLEALQDAIVYMKAGMIDRAVVGGTDRAICTSIVHCFSKTRSLPLGNDIEACALPFSTDSKGFVISEGACTIMIEHESEALRRGARIYGFIDAIHSNNDGRNINGMDDSGQAIHATMAEAAAGRKPDYINSQALGSRTNDAIEYRNAQELYANEVKVTTIKGIIGHSFASSGLVQMAASLLSFEHQFIPGIYRTNMKGYESLNVQLETEANIPVKEVLITAHGYGGNNVSAYLMKQ
ncbi:beta-ketoacyl synthase [Paenibacillus sp. R14(2021)]|uniref:beta-ketoacyl-[acyl-carrier-protein] synthase family protein n=1 Tax=Paenibacillus sp. R14(2021) TaxID=2859228 RepID=UPI001C612D45|nr:beta-ketoacyl synthase N-terminal-like domain-containing protein [Paenibacillus sp. R14(2021)]